MDPSRLLRKRTSPQQNTTPPRNPDHCSERTIGVVGVSQRVAEGGQSSLLLDHLLIPVGAKFVGYLLLPSSLSSLWELSGFKIHVHVREVCPSIRFGGPGGRTNMGPTNPGTTHACQMPESLAWFDPSNVERLRLTGGDLMQRFGRSACQVFRLMKHLRALAIYRFKNASSPP